MLIIPYDFRFIPKESNHRMVGEKKMAKTKKQTWSWKKFLLGLKRPAIVLIGMGLTWLGGFEQWSWVGGIAAERVWMTVEWYLVNTRR